MSFSSEKLRALAKTMTYLFIDNDLEDIEMYKEAIGYINQSLSFAAQNMNISCEALTNCSNVIDYIQKLSKKPDVIFLDINMPHMGGKECLKVLKSNRDTSSIPVVMLSTSCPLADAVEYKNLGALQCIRKPNAFIGLVKIFSSTAQEAIRKTSHS
jgi:CheY-like chemotaxis protein